MPVVNSGLKCFIILSVCKKRRGQVNILRALQDKISGLISMKCKCRAHSTLPILLDRNGCRQPQAQTFTVKDSAVLRKVRFMVIARKIKRGSANHIEGKGTAYHLY